MSQCHKLGCSEDKADGLRLCPEHDAEFRQQHLGATHIEQYIDPAATVPEEPETEDAVVTVGQAKEAADRALADFSARWDDGKTARFMKAGPDTVDALREAACAGYGAPFKFRGVLVKSDPFMNEGAVEVS